MLVLQKQTTPISNICWKIQILATNTIDGPKHNERDFEELLRRVPMLKALWD